MKKLLRALAALVAAAALAVTVVLSLPSTAFFKEYDSGDYIKDLTSIYKKYDSDLGNIDKNDELALRRIITFEYNGKRYGCAERAWDKESGFAVLQYNTRDDAAKALKKMRADGLPAEGDCLGELDEVGAMNPVFSADIGTTPYIGKINMDTEDIVVAVIDTGIMYDHPSLQDRMYSEGTDYSADANPDAYYDASHTYDKYYHGTFVCSIIAENTPANVKFQPYKVVSNDGTLTGSAIVSAINSAVSLGVSCINASLYTTRSGNAIDYAVNKAVKKKICICTSAGNGEKVGDSYEGVLIEDRYPTCSPGAIVVAAVGFDSSTNTYRRLKFSNYGDEVDFTAPGYRVYGIVPDENAPHAYSGTSFSTPYVTACCACLKTINNDLTRDQVYDILRDFSHDLGDEGWDEKTGHGMPDIGDIIFTDGENYSYRIPEGMLSVHSSADYTAETQPWKLFADRLVTATLDSSLTEVGSYTFYNVSHAQISYGDSITSVGDYAFANTNITEFTFGEDVEHIGSKAFDGLGDEFVINGYRNTPAEAYAYVENVNFNILGCKHNLIYETFDPTDENDGYTLFSCTVCGESYVGEYIPPVTVAEGQCGESLYYTLYESGKLVINGEGDMYDYFNLDAPWNDYRSDIKILEVRRNVGELSPYAFYGCTSLVKINCSPLNQLYDCDSLNLITKAEGRLVITAAKISFEMPESVREFDSTAFFCAGNFGITPNSRFTVKNNTVFDLDGNIVMALPSYQYSTLKIEDNISVNDNAFLLTQKPDYLETMYLGATFGEHSIGYYYNGRLNKTDLTVRACNTSSAHAYAVANEFETDTYGINLCGSDMTWKYDDETDTLYISGSGAMYPSQSLDGVPWKDCLSTVRKIVISEHITSVCDYAFYNATDLRSLTLPISINAFENNTVWYGCTNITALNITHGTGVSDDYVKDGTELYTFTPWYLSRNSITSYSIDENAVYIGVEMFRNSKFIKSLTFNCIEEIADRAFIAASEIQSFTNYSRNTVYGDYSVSSYKLGSKLGYYGRVTTVYAYNDSTSYDYTQGTDGKVLFESLGCGHSRSSEFIQTVTGISCCVCENEYRCDDCGEVFTLLEAPAGAGHAVSFSVTNLTGTAIAGAEIYAGGALLGTADGNGALSANLLCGEYELCVKHHGFDLFTTELTVDGADVCATVCICYGDFTGDSAVNAKDFAFLYRRGYNEKALFNYGKITQERQSSIICTQPEP